MKRGCNEVVVDGPGRQARLQRRQEERLAAVGTLAAGLAHEIRNPLNGAQLHLAFLARALSGAGSQAEMGEAVQVVSDELRRLATLVSEFLDFARPRPLSIKATMIAPLCERVLQRIDAAAKTHGIRVTADLPTKDVVVQADPAKLEQVLFNLVQNAVEALASRRTGRVVVRVRRKPRAVTIEVEDDGPGLEMPTAPIFDAFYTTKAAGTGLGLTITHRIVSDHGGGIEVSSKPGATVFRVSLPHFAHGKTH